MSDHHITISAVELSNTDHSVLTVATRLLEKNSIEMNILNKGDTSGTILLVDVDTPVGREFYHQFSATRSRSLLLLSSETLKDPRNMVLKKPLRVQTLKDTLADICAILMPQSKTPIKAQENVPSSPVKLSHTLFFLLLKAKQEKQIVQIFCYPHSPLFVNAIDGVVATSVSREILGQIIRNQCYALKNTKLSVSDFETLAKGQLIISLSHILWSTALYGSHGQLIEGHFPNVPVQLKKWPNLPRLEFDPDHIKLASVMTRQPLTLVEIEQKTQLPWGTIVGFYNAACATDLVLVNPRNLPLFSNKKEPPKVGLFTKIAQRLKLASKSFIF
jgi:hypothetical protein